MKRMIHSSITVPEKGSAPTSNTRKGIFVFGRDKEIELPNGWTVKFATGNVLFDTNTGRCYVYANVAVYTPSRVVRNTRYNYKPSKSRRLAKEYFSLTAEEVESLYDQLSSMTSDELYDHYGDKVKYPDYYEILD